MTKITIEDVIESLRAQKIPAETVTKVVNDLKQAAAEAKAEKETSGPKAKNQYVVIANDPEGKLQGVELFGWVLTLEESASPAIALDRVKAAGHAFNQSKKGRKLPVSNVAEVFECVPRKWWKSERGDEKTLSKTKVAVYIQRTDGKL